MGTRNERVFQLLKEKKKRKVDVARALGISPSAVTQWEKNGTDPDFEQCLRLAELFGVPWENIYYPKEILSAIDNVSTNIALKVCETRGEYNAITNKACRIKILGSVPAGIPIEAIEDIVGWEEIPSEWTDGGKEYFGLRVHGDSMSPEYLDGDTIILRKQDDCESGDDCVVYINGYDATFKRVIKKESHIILQPINPSYELKAYGVNDSIKIAGIVVEMRRSKRR